MSLDVTLTALKPTEVFGCNITHNLNKMAAAAGIYQCMWRPEELGITRAEQLIAPLTLGLSKLRANPDEYKQYNAPNGWGNYYNLVQFVELYLAACIANPDATVEVCR